MVELKIKIPQDYLEEEIRCEYKVTAWRKKMWAVELDLLAEFDRVCKQYNLHYCLGAGTLLGAIRHQGFIPWDNDIDVYMLRPEYDKLMKLAKQFKAPYFLQNSYTEKKLLRTHAQLRNSDTTGYPLPEETYDINKGIFIDIFPLDGVSPSQEKNALQKKCNDKYVALFQKYNSINSNAETVSWNDKLQKWFWKAYFFIMNKEKIYKKYEQNLKQFSKKGTKVWGNRTLVFECPKSRRPLEDYTKLVRTSFEFLSVPIPCNYDSMLCQQYGNYMRIPRNKNTMVHGKMMVSTDRSYLEGKGGKIL